jgi:superfamily II DNA/RNA helicase
MSPTFAQLGVPDAVCESLARRGITEPFPIQAATVADALAGRDVCGRAPTGSGKTLAFGIPLVTTVERGTPGRPRALVLAPTRELADQIAVELRHLSNDVRVAVAYGGVGYGPQLKALRRGVDILVACPGRLEDLLSQNALELCAVDQVVLDEADRMCDMGFLPVVRRLLDQTASKRQTVLFSATLDGDVAQLTREYQHDPVRHEVGPTEQELTAAAHFFWRVDRTDRVDVAAAAVDAVWPAIVFCRTRHGADRVARQLRQRGVEAVPIHGGRSQSQRTRALADFTSGKAQALIATDVAARGIHVDGVAAVVHFDPPEDEKAYVHRSGRTARAGRTGVVLSLVQAEQVKPLRKLQRELDLDEGVTDPDPALLRDPDSAPRPKPARAETVANAGGQSRHRKPDGANRQRRNGAARSTVRQASRGRGRPNERSGSNRPKAKGQRRSR